MTKERSFLGFLKETPGLLWNKILNLPKIPVIILNFVFLGLVAAFDYATGYEVLVTLLYLIPIISASILIGRNWGIFFSVLCALTIGLINLSGHAYSSGIIAVWNGFMILGVFLVIAIVITGLKESRIKEKYLATFPTFNPSPVVETDLNGNIIYSNPAFEKIFDDLLQKRISHPFFQDWEIAIKPLKNGTAARVEREVRINNAWYSQVMHFISQKNAVRIYAADITQKKLKEEELELKVKEFFARRIMA